MSDAASLGCCALSSPSSLGVFLTCHCHSHTHRKVGQASPAELASRDLLAELEAKERQHYQAMKQSGQLSSIPAAVAAADSTLAIADEKHDTLSATQAQKVEQFTAEAVPEQWSDTSSGSSSGGGGSGSDSSDSDDDEAELMAELQKIQAAREATAGAQASAQAAAAAATARQGNPLLAPDGSAAVAAAVVRRRWGDDAVFQNQAAMVGRKKKRFINDTLHSDFHKSFMSKVIK